MFFKNLHIYRLPALWLPPFPALAEQLARGPFVKCPSNQPVSRGWVPPTNDCDLLYVSGWQVMLALATEQRLLPSSVVNDEVRERAKLFAAETGYAPGRKQLRDLRERVIEELLPRAFTRTTITRVWIDPSEGWLCIDTGSQAKAEEVIEHLRLCLDDFPLSLPRTVMSPQSAMAGWLAVGDLHDNFTVDRDCQVKGVGEEKTTVTYQRCTVEGADEIRGQLAKGLLPTKLAMTWDDRLSFVLHENLAVKRLTFLDLTTEAETPDDQFQADFALMTGELSRFLPQLVEALGGEAEECA